MPLLPIGRLLHFEQNKKKKKWKKNRKSRKERGEMSNVKNNKNVYAGQTRGSAPAGGTMYFLDRQSVYNRHFSTISADFRLFESRGPKL